MAYGKLRAWQWPDYLHTISSVRRFLIELVTYLKHVQHHNNRAFPFRRDPFILKCFSKPLDSVCVVKKGLLAPGRRSGSNHSQTRSDPSMEKGCTVFVYRQAREKQRSFNFILSTKDSVLACQGNLQQSSKRQVTFRDEVSKSTHRSFDRLTAIPR